MRIGKGQSDAEKSLDREIIEDEEMEREERIDKALSKFFIF